MAPERYNETINFVKERYHQFKLSFEQAEKIYEFEKLRDLPANNSSFSIWEEEDFTLDNFQKILNEKQLKKFIAWQKENLRAHEQHLIDSEKEQDKYIDYYNELINFYKEKFVPEFLKEIVVIDRAISIDNKSKVDFLKQEYQKCLDTQQRNILISHYRHHKLFSPKHLQVNILRNRLNYILPSYSIFKGCMDKPTEAVADFLLKRYHFIPKQLESFFKSREKENSNFFEGIKLKYTGDPKGWHFTITESERKQKESEIMQVILIDKDFYGCEK